MNMRNILKLEVQVLAGYQTIQKKILIDFLQKHSDSAYTVEELIDAMTLEVGSEMPGKSTVYRLITKMADEGGIKKFVRGRSFVYQITGGEKCSSHLHLKCTNCGKLLHMDNTDTKRILNQVLSSNLFKIDEAQTVLMGTCKACAGRGKND